MFLQTLNFISCVYNFSSEYTFICCIQLVFIVNFILVFNAMFMHNTRERKTGRVEIQDSDPDIYKQMLEFMYTDKVGSPNMELLQVAHKYEIHGLQILCEKELAEK